MSTSIVLDVAIGLVFVYLTLSLICSALQELTATVLKWRAATLKEGIENLLLDPNIRDAQGQVRDLAEEVYKHPLVEKLAKAGRDPSYIPARNFTLALVDVLKDPGVSGGPLTEAERTISNLPDGQLKRALSGLIDGTQQDLGELRSNIENWFDDSMDRVSGWYKRKAQKLMVVLALLITVSFNVDTIKLVERLWQDPVLRAEMVAAAEKAAQDRDGPEAATIKENKAKLEKLPIGWQRLADEDQEPWKLGALFLTLLGWTLTTIALSLGAPFWFDGLSKLVNIRSTGKKPQPASG